MTNSQLKKQEIEKKIQAIEQRFDNKFQATKETIELGKSPQKLVSKRPLSSLLITFGLKICIGRFYFVPLQIFFIWFKFFIFLEVKTTIWPCLHSSRPTFCPKPLFEPVIKIILCISFYLKKSFFPGMSNLIFAIAPTSAIVINNSSKFFPPKQQLLTVLPICVQSIVKK